MFVKFGVFALGDRQVSLKSHCVNKKTLLLARNNSSMCFLRFFTLLLLFLFIVFDYVGNIHICLTSSPHPLPPSSAVGYGLFETKDVSVVKRTFIDMVVFHLLILILWLISLLYQAWLHMCNNTHYVLFDTNLIYLRKIKIQFSHCSRVYGTHPLAS